MGHEIELLIIRIFQRFKKKNMLWITLYFIFLRVKLMVNQG